MLDPQIVESVVTHMNEDHNDALLLYARVFTEYADSDSAKMLYVDEQGIDILCIVAGQQHATRIPFTQAINNAGQVRERLLAMVKQAQAALTS